MKKLLSIILVGLMVVTMLPFTPLTASAATEATELSSSTYITYSDGVTQYLKHDNYLYKVTFTNLKNTERLSFVIQYDYLRIKPQDSGITNLLANDGSTNLKKSDFPNSEGGVLNCYSTNTKRVIDTNKPIVIITCMAVNEPVWSWSDSSATAAFTSTDGKATMTVNATIESSEQTAVTCLENDKTTYTATATANGKAYTNEKTVDGEQGPHSFEYSGDDVIGSCTNGCGYECPHENQTGLACEICGADIHVCSNYNNGFCTECDAYEPAELNENGYYEIGNAGQLFWYANYINTVDRTANAVLVADIDLENRPWTPIGSTGENSNNFRGIFDGQNYTIRGLYVEGGRAGLGFFGEVRTGTVKNFTIYGEVVVNTEVDYVGGVIGSVCGLNSTDHGLERNGAIIQNIKSFVNLTAKAHGVGKIGGFVGYANHQSLIENCSWYGTFDAGKYRVDNGAGGFIGRIQENSSEVTIRNCAAFGTIKTNYAGDYNNTATIYMGGFLSFSNTSAKTTLENCLFAGKFERGENLTDEAFLGAFGTLRSVEAIKNCYYLGDNGLEAVHSDSNLKPGSDNVEITKVTAEQLKSGEVAYKLQEANEIWGQSIGTDSFPVLGGEEVYYGYIFCDDEVMVYTNDSTVSATKPDHAWGEGVLTRPTKTADGYYTYTCSACGETKTEPVLRAANYDEYEKALNDLRAYLDSDMLTDENKSYISEWLATYDTDEAFSFIAGEEATVQEYIDATVYYASEIEAAIEDCLAGNHSGNGETCEICGATIKFATITDGTNTYYAADAATLNQAVTAILETGSRTFTVELPADTEAEMITAIRRAICDTEGVADGSINLTLKGVTSIPGTTNWDGVAFGPRNAQWDENNVEIVSHEEVTQLASVNLPDATEIGAQAFYVCENLVSVSAPKAQTIGENAFAYTALTSVEFPELTAIPGTMLGGTWTLSSAKFPKVTTIEQNGLMIGFGFAPENNPTAFPLELTAEGDITFNGSNHFNIADQNYSGKVDLVLNIDKKDQVTFNDDGTAAWQVRDDLSYTFKSITFTCTDGTTNHSYTYTDNGDGTHNKVCSECGYVAASENHTLTYSVDGNTITAYCSANCGYSGTATISATGKTYDGNAVEVVVSKTGSLENTDIPVTLTKDGEAFTGAPVNAGTYTASIGIGENENAVVAGVEFIIENANPVIAAAPTPNTLTYIGEAQYLISAGEAVGGTMVYSLTENGEYTTSIPQGTNAGDYTVWYYVQGDANRNDSAKASVSVNIAKATVTVTANDTTITYGEAPINTGVTYSGFVNGEDETVLGGELAYTYTYTQNGNVGDYSITPEGLTADNYEITFVDGTLTVEQIDIGDIIDEMKINLEQYSYVYDGTEKKPKVTSITVDGVTLTEGTDYTVRYEDNVNVGEEATAVITFEGNYDGTFRKWFTITKAYYNLTAPTPNTLTYNGEDQYLVSAGTVEGADFEYSLDGVSWSTSIPQAKDVGNYTVYYRVLADENHYGIEGTVDVTIKECTHEWGEGVLTRPVHDTVLGSKDGYYTYTCTVCGEEKTEAVKSADYSAYEAVSEEINALLQSDELTDAAKQAIYSAANECGLPSNDLTESEQNIVDDLVAELEKIVDTAEEKIASGEYVKIDGMKEYNKIADALDAELMENYSQEEIAALAEKAGDEINARLGEIIEKAEALTGSVAENKDALAEIESEMRALYGEMKNCLDGVHNGLVYEVTEEAKCEVNAIESATCTLCGETDEREIEGTALEHEPNEQMCKGYWCSRCRSFYGEGNPDIHLDGYSSTGKIKDGQCDGCNKQLAFIKSGETYEINSYAYVVEFAPVVDGRYILTVDGPEGTEIDVREVVDGVNKGINCEVISDLVYVVDCTVGKTYRFEASNYYGYNISSMTLECETHKGTVQTCYGYICDACGEYFGEVPGHDIIIDEAVPPTCTQTGLTEGQHCSRCDDMTIIQEKVPATNHKDTLVKVDAKAATCTEAGWEAYEYCTACDYTTYEEIPALKHSFTKYEVTEEAECGKAGKEVAYCDHGCQTTDEREIPALKHSFTKYEVAEEAECGKTGKEVAYCDHGCGATDEKEIPALTHEPLEAVKENEVAPKCGVAGSYDLVVYCDLCGDELDRDTVTVDALTHKDEDGDYLCDHGCGHEFQKPSEPDTPDTPDEPTDDTCDHLCHKSGFMGFIWKIINFFFRLFDIQQYCDCGDLHYEKAFIG